ncbi:MAG: hypothetical protein WCO25_04370 [Candidatus Uhrbacteria bacterium]
MPKEQEAFITELVRLQTGVGPPPAEPPPSESSVVVCSGPKIKLVIDPEWRGTMIVDIEGRRITIVVAT